MRWPGMTDPTFTDLLRRHLPFADAVQLTADSKLRELGLDSMLAIELIFALEDTFGVVFPDEVLSESTFETAGSLWTAIEQLRTASPERRAR